MSKHRVSATFSDGSTISRLTQADYTHAFAIFRKDTGARETNGGSCGFSSTRELAVKAAHKYFGGADSLYKHWSDQYRVEIVEADQEPFYSPEELLDEQIAQAAAKRASEYMEIEAVVQEHINSGDFKCNDQLAELIVAGYRSQPGPARNKVFESIGSLLIMELRFSIEIEAEKHIRAERNV